MSHVHPRRLLTVEAGDDALLVRLTDGHLALTDENVLSLETLLASLADRTAGRQLVLDFSNVELITSTALDALVRLHLRLRDSGGGLAVRDLSDNVYEVFEVSRLVNLFDVRRALPQA